MIVIGPEVVEWAREKFGVADFGPAVGIGWKRNELVAAVLFNGYTKTNICMHVVSEGKHWMTREYLRVCFDYPFNQVGVKRITGVVESGNEAALRFNRHLGFREEAVIHDGCEAGDLILMGMYRDECRFLR